MEKGVDKWSVTWFLDDVVGTMEIPMWYFYVLQSLRKPDYFYKGSTGDLRRRLRQHNDGETESNCPYRPFRFVYYEAYLSERAAREREMHVKRSGSISVPLIRRIRNSLGLS